MIDDLVEKISNISIEKLLSNLNYLSHDELKEVKKAYDFAFLKHKGQFRKSGEAYIIHPLSVAYILSYFYKPDVDTIVACLLHDVVEDTATSLTEIAMKFNLTVATLVDGVTKFSSKNFNDKKSKNDANRRKIITSIERDPRSIIIKLADNLHNALTLQYHKPEKRVENAKESLELYVSFARCMGMNRLANILSEVALKYTLDNYSNMKEEINKFIIRHEQDVTSLQESLKSNIRCQSIEVDYKDMYSISKLLTKKASLEVLKDMIKIKLIVDDKDECYKAYSIISKMYPTFNENFIDYISSSKEGTYQSIDGPLTYNITLQIRTPEMDKLAVDGIASYWELYGKDAKDKMVELLKKKSDFYKSVISMNEKLKKNSEFINAASSVLNSDNFTSILYGSVDDNITYSSMVKMILTENLKNNSEPINITSSILGDDDFNSILNGKVGKDIPYSPMIRKVMSQSELPDINPIYRYTIDLEEKGAYVKKIE